MTKPENPLHVTRPFLPPLKEFLPYLKEIWKSRILTNNGPFLQEFEKKLAGYLDVPYVTAVASGTSALELAIECLELKGEVITTPYTFAATSQVLLLRNITPVYVDIEPRSCTIDPDKIEQAITQRTTAILPVHVYGFPCNTEKIKAIAGKYKLKIIYDAAHAFGVRYNGKRIASYGDVSVFSFHATKILNTFEGGAVVCHDYNIKKKLDALRNFGLYNKEYVVNMGTNAKMNEFQAALGILQIKYADKIIARQKELYHLYLKGLSSIKGLSYYEVPDNTEWNYSFLPVFINESCRLSRDTLMAVMEDNGIHCRKYFWPVLSTFDLFKQHSILSGKMGTALLRSNEVICLPIYPDLNKRDVYRIIKIIEQSL
jgi:dTDP-4-amino-4,6-dideoxygalactose transaminase